MEKDLSRFGSRICLDEIIFQIFILLIRCYVWEGHFFLRTWLLLPLRQPLLVLHPRMRLSSLTTVVVAMIITNDGEDLDVNDNQHGDDSSTWYLKSPRYVCGK